MNRRQNSRCVIFFWKSFSSSFSSNLLDLTMTNEGGLTDERLSAILHGAELDTGGYTASRNGYA